MKITVITMQGIRNYGSALQAFATQEFFVSLGLDCEILNYVREDSKGKNLLNWMTSKDKGVKKLFKEIILLPSVLKLNKVFNMFNNRFLNLSEYVYSTETDFKMHPVKTDIYCTGSDQVWNSGWNKGIIKPLFLSFAPDDAPKISFAASFGKEQLETWEVAETKILLSRYDFITVRETSALKILDKLGIKNSRAILDPTLIMTKEFWLSKCSKYGTKWKTIKNRYVLIYQLNNCQKDTNYAYELARKKGLKLIRFCTRYDQILRRGIPAIIPNVLEFVAAIENAAFVVTDSFHATAFSINMNKMFLSFYPQEYSTRLKDILELFHLESRHVIDYSNMEQIDSLIDYDKVNHTLALSRQAIREEFKEKICLIEEKKK